MSDDLDDNLDLGDSSFDDAGNTKSKTLGDVWRDSPVFKIVILVVAVGAIIGTIMLFGKEDKPVDPSFMPGGSEIAAPPGTAEATPAYVAAVQEENEARVEIAQREGSSALPTPIEPPVGRLSVPEKEEETEDPLQRWRQLQEERLQRELQRTQSSAPSRLAEGTATEAQQALAEAMTAQMQSILERQTESKLGTMNITAPDFLEKLAEKERERAEKANGGTGNGNGNGGADGDGFFEDEDLEGMGTVLVEAGKIAYAQLLTEANTDVPGPVLAEIVSGPLAGSRVLGEFKEDNELLSLTFTTVVYNGESIEIDAVALDPETTLPGMATDVDHHYLKRIALPMAAAFVEGMASAISESGLTTVTVSGDVVAEESEETSNEQDVASGIEEAGQELREILDEMADETEVTVRVEAGTPMGILFLEPVVEGGEENAAADGT